MGANHAAQNVSRGRDKDDDVDDAVVEDLFMKCAKRTMDGNNRLLVELLLDIVRAT